MLVCLSVSLCILQPCCSARQQGIVCNVVLPVYGGAPACWFITSALCRLISLLDCVFGAPICHLLMCHIVTSSVWGICDSRGNLTKKQQLGDLEKTRSEKRDQNLCIQWLGYSRKHRQQFWRRVAEYQAGWWGISLDVYCTNLCVGGTCDSL